MSTNLYFAYSIKKEYKSPPLALNGSSSSSVSDSGKERKKYLRACDACAIRKTKCEETRPCRNCRNNGLECTELRERKKMGPKKLRKSTMESIQSLEKSAKESGSDVPVLAATADLLADTPTLELTARALVPLTVSSSSLCLPEMLIYLRNSAPHKPDTLETQASDAALASLALLLLAALSATEMTCGAEIDTHIQLMVDHVASVYADVSRRSFLSSDQTTTSATHYNLALAELHMYGYFMFKGSAFCVRQLVHLRGAISHYQLISMSSDSDISGLSELRRTLYSAERSACLFSTEEVFKSTCLISSGPSSPFYSDPSLKKLVLDCGHDIFKVLEEHGVFTRSTSLPNLFLWRYVTFQSQTGVYGSIKMNAQDVSSSKCQQAGSPAPQSSFVQLLVTFISFKVLLLYSGEYTQTTVSNELLEFISRANAALSVAKTDPLFPIYLTVFSLVPHFLDLLRCYFESVNNSPPPEAHERLKEYTLLILPLCNKNAFMGVAKLDPVLSDWFARESGDFWVEPSTSASPCVVSN
ncbi:hypothetical protein FT663_04057 [Candidozyma haemuli var. vulneris]|uniref:Zn(2)-C6 fungal-type domain-containing protein n=1 Tax=Candidozyma haemuli TaxID=45357 RepID=A0A2V1AMA8_9ASCO|nr:hypothetical protein CXQ85_001207 [[Candida] haemuloni]KAF3988305.1 hypothetical protein FT662_03501 [[Candida] haemuloni var. vulneris]KAF3988374.1 hypothetical protein FT663_04057 [[Candida] haemuloni var. vulneris]PVH18915.1 hypothetical protein CXQ85_001207 [[Candida] haemuloni]